MPRTPGFAAAPPGVRDASQPAEGRQLLLHLRDVPMAADAVRLHALVDLAEHEVLLRLAAGPGDAGLRVDDQVADQPCPRHRCEREERGRRVAARRPDDRGPGLPKRRQRIVMELGEAVHGAGEEVGPRMREAVPARVVGRVAEPEIRPQVDDRGAVRREVGHDLRGGAVGQRKEDRVRVGDRRVHVEPGPVEVDMGPADRLAGAAAADQPFDLHVRVPREEPDELGADVARGAHDRDTDARAPGRRRTVGSAAARQRDRPGDRERPRRRSRRSRSRARGAAHGRLPRGRRGGRCHPAGGFVHDAHDYTGLMHSHASGRFRRPSPPLPGPQQQGMTTRRRSKLATRTVWRGRAADRSPSWSVAERRSTTGGPQHPIEWRRPRSV